MFYPYTSLEPAGMGSGLGFGISVGSSLSLSGGFVTARSVRVGWPLPFFFAIGQHLPTIS